MSSDDDFSVRVDFNRILQTISASIYDNQYAFLRENVQNAIDAIRIQAAREGISCGDARYRIDVHIEGNVCSIQDNGIGMNKEELRNNFWTMGASGKNTPEAKAAGCIGVFGIGGFANFGVCETLEVISRTDRCEKAHHTMLSRAAFDAQRYSLPVVKYMETEELRARGTIVRGTATSAFNIADLTNYLRQFVRFVREPVYMQGKPIAQDEPDKPSGTYRTLATNLKAADGDTEIELDLLADAGHNLSARVTALRIGNNPVPVGGYLRLVHGQLDVYKRGFRICSVSISSRIGVTGYLDADVLQPTAGRDTLESKSTTFLTRLFRQLEIAVWPFILSDADLLGNHTRLLPDLIGHGHLEKLGQLKVATLNKQAYFLKDLRDLSEHERRVFYTHANQVSSAAEVLQARGHIIVSVSADSQRRSAEIEYLRTYCRAEQFENLIELLEPYTGLDAFERGVLAELEYAIRKLFAPSDFRLSAGKLTLDAPIYWTNKKEGGATIVLVDTKHGEFTKLRPLGFSGLFWSMIEAFCREYLGDTLKRQSPKFFGSGAIDLDSYSKSHAELWELLSTDIAISRIETTQTTAAPKQSAARIVVVRSTDVQRLTISVNDGVVASEAVSIDAPSNQQKRLPKVLNIIDETKATGLEGFYLRIPESATAAFGDLIRTFPSFVVVWFANRITWQATDLESTAFLFDIVLDRLIQSDSAQAVSHGALELSTAKIQFYSDQIYFFIPSALQKYVVPTPDNAVKIELTHELVDLDKPRAWTSRSKDKEPA